MALFDLKVYLKQIYPDEHESVLASFEKPKDICIFLNTLKTDDKCLEYELSKEHIPFERLDEFTYRIKGEYKSKLSFSKAFLEHLFYIQNYSSYLCAKALNAKPYESVLDMCAAPGGKSINLANFMQNKGYLACVEASKDRFFTLQKILKNYGVLNFKCFLKDAKLIGKLCPLKFDKILLDAPCSTFAKMGLYVQKSQKELKMLSILQKKLLHSALKALKVNGELVYSTCTFLKEENEEVIKNALKSEFKLKLLELNLEGVNAKNAFADEFDELKKAKRILPDTFCDGFFVAKLKKLS
ncbi:RsmB/NOP family class I SAM-dependent RNA methyltransferase [Campylobacter sp. MIT 99-7217]|uniref:RsmB/NOP family class I SAM-dependent RNA methyltransferase n=1 Tax=Campylobacter sp. MIT 99-7217 TaxID=535091 RepID=UPI0039183A81